jgi:hypothetical protein
MAEKKSKLVEIRTKPTVASVEDFIKAIPDEQKRKNCLVLLQMMEKATKEVPVIWSNSTIGFGIRRYKSPASGREVDWLRIGFAPRKANISLYLNINFEKNATTLKKLGKHKTSVGCMYINKLEEIDTKVLNSLIEIAASMDK